MQRILEAFATENLSVEPVTLEGGTEYQRARNLYADLGEQLLAKLNKEEKELLEKYTDAMAEESHLYSVERFIDGYRLGVLMTMEVFTGGRDLILKKGDSNIKEEMPE